MLGSLRARLTISFALDVALAVFLAGFGALFLLRDQQQATVRERYGRVAEPLNLSLNGMLAGGSTLDAVQPKLDGSGRDFGVRVLVIDADLKVVHDSEAKLEGRYILSFENPSVKVLETSGARYKAASYGAADLELFAPPNVGDGTQPYNVLVAVPAGELASAWLDLAPRLAIASAIALIVSFVVAFFISRSISGPLRKITQASVQMAQGNYDVHIAIRGEDEVGRLAEAFNRMA
jgi:two-component system sensor histidine kinase ResE